VAEQAAKADAVVDEAHIAGLGASHPLTVQAKMLRQELLRVKADLERELRGGARLLGVRPDGALGRRARHPAGSLGHREPAPHGAPVL
jgi:hypothetical protein